MPGILEEHPYSERGLYEQKWLVNCADLGSGGQVGKKRKLTNFLFVLNKKAMCNLS